MRFIVLRRWSVTDGLVKEVIAENRDKVIERIVKEIGPKEEVVIMTENETRILVDAFNRVLDGLEKEVPFKIV